MIVGDESQNKGIGEEEPILENKWSNEPGCREPSYDNVRRPIVDPLEVHEKRMLRNLVDVRYKKESSDSSKMLMNKPREGSIHIYSRLWNRPP